MQPYNILSILYLNYKYIYMYINEIFILLGNHNIISFIKLINDVNILYESLVIFFDCLSSRMTKNNLVSQIKLLYKVYNWGKILKI